MKRLFTVGDIDAGGREDVKNAIIGRCVADVGTGCLEYSMARDHYGYGSITVDQVVWKTHRLMWHSTMGDIPEGMYVLHKCDNRACCNIEHLFLGTAMDNMVDMVKKGRSRNGRTVLSQDDVLRILARAMSGNEQQRDIAKEYGVTPATVSDILSGKSWSSVTGREYAPVHRT